MTTKANDLTVKQALFLVLVENNLQKEQEAELNNKEKEYEREPNQNKQAIGKNKRDKGGVNPHLRAQFAKRKR